MEVTASFDRDSVDAYAKTLGDTADRMLHLQPAFLRIIDDFQTSERAIFATAGASEGLDWPPIAADTVRRHPEHHGEMRMSDTLMRSLTVRNARYAIRTIRDDELVVGTRDPVGNLAQHQRGGNPVRQVMFVSDLRGERWIGFIGDHIFTSGSDDRPASLSGNGL